MRPSKPKVPPPKFTIKPPNVKPLPDNWEQDMWAKLQQAMSAVHSGQPLGHPYEILYHDVKDMCIMDMAPRLFERLERELEKYIEGRLDALVAQENESIDFLARAHACWTAHCEEMKVFGKVFLWLDRTYIMRESKKKSLWEVGLNIFRANVSRTDAAKKVVDGALVAIGRERAGEDVPAERSLLSSLLTMLHELGLYHEMFEQPFLHATRQFYDAESAAKLQSSEVPAYLSYAADRLAQEAGRVEAYLHKSTRTPLEHVINHVLITTHLDALVEMGFDRLMDGCHVEDLKRMYDLFALVDALPKLRSAFGAYIKKVGSAMVTDAERDRVLVQVHHVAT